MNGILNILKPPNMTSHDVVSYIRKKIKVKKVGHTGTLDPMAVGVLPICLGKATKIVEFMQNDFKIYRAELTLGTVTETQDKWGKVISKKCVNVTEDKIYNIINNFIGEIEQIPPMYSALKHKGKKLYELARMGITVERKSRKVLIHNINVIKINNNKILFDVKCSKGTYIRTLCNDIGLALGTGGHMSFLARLQNGVFKISDSITLEELNNLCIDEINNKFLYNIDYPLYFLPRVNISSSLLKKVLNGVPIRNGSYSSDVNLKNNDIIRLYINNKFIAIGLYLVDKDSSVIKIKKLFSK